MYLWCVLCLVAVVCTIQRPQNVFDSCVGLRTCVGGLSWRRYKGLGLVGLGSGAVTKEERRIRDKGLRRTQMFQMRLGMSNNKSDMNKHFREQNTQ